MKRKTQAVSLSLGGFFVLVMVLFNFIEFEWIGFLYVSFVMIIGFLNWIELDKNKSCSTKRGVSELKLSKAQSPNINYQTTQQVAPSKSAEPTSDNNNIDGNKDNNQLSNLLLFPTKSAHTKFHYDNGDLKLKAGGNKKKLVNGKLKCCHCNKYKTLDKFVKKSKAYLGVISVCKNCRKLQRRHWDE